MKRYKDEFKDLLYLAEECYTMHMERLPSDIILKPSRYVGILKALELWRKQQIERCIIREQAQPTPDDWDYINGITEIIRNSIFKEERFNNIQNIFN